MLSTSFEFRKKISEGTDIRFKATLTLADGTVREISGDDVMMGGASFSESTSSSSSFDIGAAVMGKLQVTLNNSDERFSTYDFTDSTIVAYVGVELDEVDEETGEHVIEWLRKGVYGIDQPQSYGNTISLTALDNMRLLERPYSDVTTAYPATLGEIVRDICLTCGVTLRSIGFANNTYRVAARPNDSSLTCMQALAYVAQASGNFARIDPLGQLFLDWYNTNVFEDEDWLDGDRFDEDDPYSSGDTADGGDFLDYSSGDVVNGGTFSAGRYAYLFAFNSLSVSTDDVVVTGVSVTASAEILQDGSTGRDGESALFGDTGYVLSIESNPLVLFGQASTVASQIGARVVGMRFRPFDGSALGNPAIESGDPVVLVDRLMNQYTSYITSASYTIGGYERYACNAETPSRNSADTYSALTKAIVEARNAVKGEKSARQAAIENLTTLLNGASGLFKTEVTQPDGSTVYYLHDKRTLAESQIVWKLGAEAFGVSTNGLPAEGEPWPIGFDAWGNAILNSIYAVGIDASYITTGMIRSRDSQSYWDLDNSELTVSGGTISGSTIVGSMIESSDNRISIDLTTASAIGGILLSNSTYYARNLYLLISYKGIQLCTVTKDASGHITTFTPYKAIGCDIYENGTDPNGMSIGTSNSYASFDYGGEVAIDATRYIHIGQNNSPQIQCYGTFSVAGTKSRLVETDNYGERLLYCYETPSPMFGDIGSGVIGDDGCCYVEIDDIFSETVRTDYAYQVFLQKCGSGECWADEKTPTHFVVRGTPGLAFDWELKARQYDYTTTRLENNALDNELNDERAYGSDYETIYADEFGLVDELERMLYEAA